MARSRTPRAKAAVEGRDKKDPGRFRGRKEPKVEGGLGDPPSWLKDTDSNKPREAWAIIKSEIPWLNSSHRMLVATACNQLGRLIAGQEVGVQASIFIKQCLGAMGATPADSSKITVPDADQESEDDGLGD